MGCGSSKAEEPPLVGLCRERRELIRAAAEHRFALAAAHAAYFRALGRVGDALHRFVQEELVAVAPTSPVLTLPPSEGKGKAKAKIERSEGESHRSGPVGASASSFASISDSHLHAPSDDESEEITGESSDIGGGSEDSVRSFPHQPFYGAPIPNYHYMKSASTVSSTTVYQNPYPTWSNTVHAGYGYYDYPVYGAPMDPMQPHAHDEHFYQIPPQREDKPSDPPPPPPPTEGSAWDFFNPFDSYEQMIPGYLHGNYGVGSATSSPNSSEVREKEGIPDLEEETEQESVIAPVKESKGADKDAAGSVSGEKGSNVAATEQEANDKGDVVAPEVKEESQDVSSVGKIEEVEMEKNTKKKSVIFEDTTSLVIDDSKPSKENALSAHGTRNMLEVATEIKEQFESAANCGKEVSEILEVGKLPLLKMWRFVLDCHHKQFQAVVESESQNFVARTGGSVAKATIELEGELLNWCSCFSNWIKAQKAYIEALNGWLLKWLLQEREETPDGVAPFSPSRIGAPGAFIIANDWYHNMDAICEAEVIDSMQTFAINIHRLWETQDEEQRQKLKAEYLSRDFARRLRSLQKENGMPGQEHMPISNGDEALHQEHKMSLDAMKRRLDEERAKHEETIIQLQQATASNLRTGLVPIFQALENFSSETLKGYEGVRISNDGFGT
ncbi:hypothetical protein B296_00012937 [Ensete ventricosum]|uniref:DUF632 domain-containing protein n=1 Tax=Ensete ventricosum TaxID=4639 RepID=A0A426YSS2_ENSVE|nr:hypothetical protein B296_00012937 [Ensete ventricosum]